MPRNLPRITAKELISVLETEGFSLLRQRGSHCRYADNEGRKTTVPIHGNRKLHPKTLKSVLRETGITVERLNELL
ncbi:MAG: putative RNA binding protein YcfA (HicA-like mRNA interferase family) [Candidatus Azotimanducaceae bacterium]|jgi:predicted RNA binding protein YcfA (HicA-like mRNA interferase family)